MWYAVHYGIYYTVKPALELHNVRVDLKHKHGQTALYPAAFAGKIGFVHLLLSSGSGPDLQHDSGHSPWDWARRFNRPVMEIFFFQTIQRPRYFLVLNHHRMLSYLFTKQYPMGP